MSAVAEMHAKDWMHRDLKMENIMIGKNGYAKVMLTSRAHLLCSRFAYNHVFTLNNLPACHAKVIDLGLAKQVSSGHVYTMCGTPVYMAPEVVKGAGYSKPVGLLAQSSYFPPSAG